MIKKVMYETRGKHTFARISMGASIDEMTPCGSLMFKDTEFKVYRKLLEDGALLSPDVRVIFIDSSHGSTSVLPKVK